jgi:hypothetical protein
MTTENTFESSRLPATDIWYNSSSVNSLHKNQDGSWLKFSPLRQAFRTGYYTVLGTDPPLTPILPVQVSEFEGVTVYHGHCLDPPPTQDPKSFEQHIKHLQQSHKVVLTRVYSQHGQS